MKRCFFAKDFVPFKRNCNFLNHDSKLQGIFFVPTLKMPINQATDANKRVWEHTVTNFESTLKYIWHEKKWSFVYRLLPQISMNFGCRNVANVEFVYKSVEQSRNWRSIRRRSPMLHHQFLNLNRSNRSSLLTNPWRTTIRNNLFSLFLFTRLEILAWNADLLPRFLLLLSTSTSNGWLSSLAYYIAQILSHKKMLPLTNS